MVGLCLVNLTNMDIHGHKFSWMDEWTDLFYFGSLLVYLLGEAKPNTKLWTPIHSTILFQKNTITYACLIKTFSNVHKFLYSSCVYMFSYMVGYKNYYPCMVALWLKVYSHIQLNGQHLVYTNPTQHSKLICMVNSML